MAIIPLIYLMIKKSYRLRTSVHINRKISWNSDRPIRRHISRLTEPFVQMTKLWKARKKKKKGGRRIRRSWEGNKDFREKKKNEELSPVIQLVSGWSVSLLVFHSYLPCGFPAVVWIYVCEFHPWLFNPFIHKCVIWLLSFSYLSWLLIMRCAKG